MLMTKNPLVYPSANAPGNKGIHLRDHFAGKALAGLLASPHNEIMDADHIRVLAELSYDFADAMLEARKRNAEE